MDQLMRVPDSSHAQAAPQVVLMQPPKRDTLTGRLLIGLFCSIVAGLLLNTFLRKLVLHVCAAILAIFGNPWAESEPAAPPKPGVIERVEEAIGKGYGAAKKDIKHLVGKDDEEDIEPLTPEEAEAVTEYQKTKQLELETERKQHEAAKAEAEAKRVRDALELEKRRQEAADKAKAAAEAAKAEQERLKKEWAAKYNAQCPNQFCRQPFYIKASQSGQRFCNSCRRYFLGSAARSLGAPPMPLPNNRQPRMFP